MQRLLFKFEALKNRLTYISVILIMKCRLFALNVGKRGSNFVTEIKSIQLDTLYPSHQSIEKLIHKYLQELLRFGPPVFHGFYNRLLASNRAEEEDNVDE